MARSIRPKPILPAPLKFLINMTKKQKVIAKIKALLMELALIEIKKELKPNKVK